MKKKSSNTGKPRNEWYFVDRLYRWLPIFLVLFSFGNVYFVIRYVNEEKVDFNVIRDQALLNASNSYVYVERSLSNEIQRVQLAMSNEVLRVRYSNDMRLRPLYTPSTNAIIKATKETVLDVRSDRRERRPFVGRFFRIGGLPFVEVCGYNYGVGGDFGYGMIESIFPTGVICDGLFYPLVSQKQEIAKNGLP